MYAVLTLEPGNGRTRTLLDGVPEARAHAAAREHVGLPADAPPSEVRDGATYYRGPSYDGPRYREPGLLAWVEAEEFVGHVYHGPGGGTAVRSWRQ